MIIISFKDEELHDDCRDLHRAEQKYGSLHADALVTLISDAWAFENVGELLDFLGEGANILTNDSLRVAIGTAYNATFIVVGRRFDRDEIGRIIWRSVTRLKLIEVSRVL